MDIDSTIASVDSKTLASAAVFAIVQTTSSESFGIVEQSFDLKDLSGSNAEVLLERLIAKGKGATQTYKLKTTTGVPNAHGHRYTESQIDYMKQELGHILYFFGYTNHPTEENNCGFFKFDNHT